MLKFSNKVKLWPLPPDREEWLALRRLGLGGSDAAAACGLSSWTSRLGLYLDKIGEGLEVEESERMYWGKKQEATIADEYALRTGDVLVEVPHIIQSVRQPFMLANLDRAILSEEKGPGVLECKTVDRFIFKLQGWGEAGTDKVPQEYLLQVMHYMAVTGWTWVRVAVLIGGNEFRIYNVPRDEALIMSLTEMEEMFWASVENRTPPEADYNHATTQDLLRKLYPNTNGEVLDLSDLGADHEALAEAKSMMKELEGAERFHKNRILAAMGEASVGIMPDGSGYTRSFRAPYRREACDVDGGMVLRFSKQVKLPK